MNIMSFNSCGLGIDKCCSISKFCYKNNINFLGLKETHLSNVDLFKLKSLWGNYNFKVAYNPAVGRSGGLISI